MSLDSPTGVGTLADFASDNTYKEDYMGSITGQDKATLEKEWSLAESRLKLSGDDKAVWNRLGYTVRPYVYFDKILVAWTIVKGEPQVKDIFTVTAMDGSFSGGLWVKTQGKISGHESIITHTPGRLAPGLSIFAWLPFFNEVRYVSANWDMPNAPRNLRLSACFKMTEDPGRARLREGIDYLTELHVFRAQFPQYKDTRF